MATFDSGDSYDTTSTTDTGTDIETNSDDAIDATADQLEEYSLDSEESTNVEDDLQLQDDTNSESDEFALETEASDDLTDEETENDVSSDEGTLALENNENEFEDAEILENQEQAPDYFQDTERISELSSYFNSEIWEQLSVEEQKDAISGLSDYNADVLGIENKPSIKYYNNEDKGDFGGYSEQDNSIYINEYNMDDSLETADTISHEFRHNYQHERALNPENENDMSYRENFDNYIPASRDFEAYQNQIVESDARNYAQTYKDFINNLGGK